MLCILSKVLQTLSTTTDVSMPPSNHLEADYRLIIHILDALGNGYSKSKVRANDTDIVVLLTAFMPKSLISIQNLN